MINMMDTIHLALPILSCIILLVGLKSRRKNFIAVSLWLSLFALILHYHASGGEILGSYFNYMHVSIYSLNLIILITSFLCLLFTSIDEMRSRFVRYSAGFIAALLITGGTLLIANLWINASFIEDRLAGTPILQVATFNKQPYCDYKYVFYKVDTNNQVKFMCPNHYGFLPSTGKLDTAPAFVVKQLPAILQAKFQQQKDKATADLAR